MNIGARISVVISTYNYGHYIASALDSVVNQSCTNWECVVIDDGSTDDTRKVVFEYAERDGRIRYLYQENQGQSVGLNRGVRESTGAYIQFLDADDLLPPEKLKQQAAYLDAHPEAGLVFGGFSFFRDNIGHNAESCQEIIEDVLPPQFDGDRELLLLLIRRNFIANSAPLIRRSVFEAVGGWDEDRDAIADWDFWIRCADGNVGMHSILDRKTHPLVRFHIDSRSADKAKFHDRSVKTRKRIHAVFKDREIFHLNRIMWGELEGYRGIRDAVQGEKLAGLRRLIRAVWISPGIRWRARWSYCIALLPVMSGVKFEKATAISVKQSNNG
jgi:glycosyltransferase involved in cell wall biosynthesis